MHWHLTLLNTKVQWNHPLINMLICCDTFVELCYRNSKSQSNQGDIGKSIKQEQWNGNLCTYINMSECEQIFLFETAISFAAERKITLLSYLFKVSDNFCSFYCWGPLVFGIFWKGGLNHKALRAQISVYTQDKYWWFSLSDIKVEKPLWQWQNILHSRAFNY